jgi:trehalose utilization protein
VSKESEVADNSIRVTVWGENLHEKQHEKVRAIYPDGMHNTIAAGLRAHLGEHAVVNTATLDQPEHGLTDEVLAETDVLTWWGHMGHHLVQDEVVDRVQDRVLAGMGLVVLHSGHWSKIFTRLMGTTCALRWRDDDRETVFTVNPGHPITRNVPSVFVIPQQEMYGEYFDIPQPDELIFLSSFTGGEVFRSGCCFRRGQGRIFYFGPGHETYPVYHQKEVQQVLANGVVYVAPIPQTRYATFTCVNSPEGWIEREGASI